MRRVLIWAPLAVFAILVLLLVFGLGRSPETQIRSHLVGKPLPEFALPAMIEAHPGLSSPDLRTGQPRLLNIFASWCLPCIVEAPQLLELKRRGIPIDAIAIRDRPEDVAKFLQRHGDPYQRMGSDRDSRVQLALGSSGVPETFVIDAKGVIRHQHIGEIRPEHVSRIVQAWEEAR
jgi:cytochrome c biogenesis protein CcmG/thiol:disulfide interchange protein DsbE